jgi:hypothetical protein
VGFRFRKSIKILPGVRLNLSKSGISTSLGGPGASINISPRGTRKTVGLPGSGMSYSTFSSHQSSSNPPPGNTQASTRNKGCGCLALGGVLLLAISMCSQKPGGLSTDPASLSSQSSSEASSLSPNGGSGMVYGPDETVYVSSNTLNARATPSTSGRIVGKLHSGDELKVVDTEGDWLKVAQGAALFWIASSHVSSAQPIRARAPQPLLGPVSGNQGSTKRSKPRRGNFIDGSCPCSGARVCVGPRGGRYCITSGGNKRYGV